MQFKTDKIEQEFNNAPLILQYAICEFEKIASLFGKPTTITSILREKGSHSNYCCADIRDEHVKTRTFTDAQVKIITDYMNEKFKRIDDYKTVIHHSVDDNPLHFHLQVGTNAQNLRGPLYNIE